MAAVNRDRLTRLFLELVRIDSLSRRERDVALRLQREVESAGAICRYDSAGEKVRGNTGNLIARIPATAPGIAPFLLCAHMDTVTPGEGVKPIVDGAVIRTDGTTVLGGDDKSGCAVICEVLHQLHDGKVPHGPIDAVFTICEEVGLQGARNLDLTMIEAKSGLVFDSDSPGYLFVSGPSAVGMRFTVRGLEAHAGMAPERGMSAIKIAAEAIAAMRLGRIDDETTANLGVIQGGRAANIVPNEVVVRGEARSRSEAKLTAQIDHMVACFADAVARAQVTVDGVHFAATLEHSAHRSYAGMNVPEDAPLVRQVIEAARRSGRTIAPAGTGGGCDANILNQRGLVVANLGTGMRDIHTVREWLDVNDMVASAEVTLELIKLHAGGW
ncbi:MAG TPA: M20/M25/M40 family metallo-hydrolase [Candidatus Binataceae bacterium]|nr:M20/M25/M40 family metallo-hydrolase [Candidatus Binataceae bacterium]